LKKDKIVIFTKLYGKQYIAIYYQYGGKSFRRVSFCYNLGYLSLTKLNQASLQRTNPEVNIA